MQKVTRTISFVGINDRTLDLFESQYILPEGVSYNSYVIHDEKTTIMDTVDKRATAEWITDVENALGEEKPYYLVVSHLEPDHSANIELLVTKYPKIKIVLSQKAASMLPQFIKKDYTDRLVIVKEGDEIDLGSHKLTFLMAPMVHWPEVMFTYEKTEKILFSADAFGRFGDADPDDDWACEARRYYFNIVGKYGTQVQAILKKVAGLEIKKICPLHGPVLEENLEYYIGKYDIWSKYEPEDDGILIAYNSIHGNTKEAVYALKQILKENGAKKVVTSDLSREDMAEVVEDAFRYDKLIIASPTYDAGLFPTTETFLRRLKHKNYQKRRVAIVENGSWAPMAGKCMREILQEMKDINLLDKQVTIKTKMTDENIKEMQELAKEILK